MLRFLLPANIRGSRTREEPLTESHQLRMPGPLPKDAEDDPAGWQVAKRRSQLPSSLSPGDSVACLPTSLPSSSG